MNIEYICDQLCAKDEKLAEVIDIVGPVHPSVPGAPVLISCAIPLSDSNFQNMPPTQ